MRTSEPTNTLQARHCGEAGQASIEMALMLVVMIFVATSTAQFFKKTDYFANLVSGPWQQLSGLIQNGVWGTPEITMAQHPNGYARISTPKGDVEAEGDLAK